MAREKIIALTTRVADYMRASDIYITKAGVLYSTETAITGKPTIHISPIPGCEISNAVYFRKRKMSMYVMNPRLDLIHALEKLQKEDVVERMLTAQEKYMDCNVTDHLCDYIAEMG